MTAENGLIHAFGDARAEYLETFAQYAVEVRRVQALESQPKSDTEELRQALNRVHEAEMSYRHRRDALAAVLLHPTACVDRIRLLAYHIWERAGRPSGTAEADWLQAERILAS